MTMRLWQFKLKNLFTKKKKAGSEWIIIYDDPASIMHTALGFAAVLWHIEVAVTLIYLLYQYMDRESVSEKKGDLVEYSVGLLAGALVRWALWLISW